MIARIVRTTDDKNFNDWMALKSKLHHLETPPKISEGEVWWCGVGENVGVEINGKSELFSRPALIFKKLSRFGFFGIPLTSQIHDGSWYVPFRFHNKDNVAVIAQIRMMSVSRLYSRMGRVDESDMRKIRTGLLKLLAE